MLYYAEDRGKRYSDSRNRYVLHRNISIWDHRGKVGYIEQMTALDGRVLSDRYGRTSNVGYYERDRDEGMRSHHIDYCKNVVEGKRIFQEWYEQNRKSKNSVDVSTIPFDSDTEFYPTPSDLAGKMAACVDWDSVYTILEPSAGKGDLADFAQKCFKKRYRGYSERSVYLERVDCIECDDNLRYLLKGKGYRVVSNDFLTFSTAKQYDLILMNPPFSNGDEHLLKAISMQKNGGQIVCLLNAETIRNPCTNRRKLLASLLSRYNARISYVDDAFSRAERRASVDVAIVSINIPKRKRQSDIMEKLKRAAEQRSSEVPEPTAVTTGDWMDQMIANYELEAKAGVALMEEYNALAPYIMSGTDRYAKPLISLSVGGKDAAFAGSETINRYLRGLRGKYWENLLNRKELTERMTNALRKEYANKIEEMQDYDFNRYNVRMVILDIQRQLAKGVEESIYALFDKLSAQHSWYPECKKNIHYYNGWATNKAHKVGMKVILPINGFHSLWGDKRKEIRAHEFAGDISDIERALHYLDLGETSSHVDTFSVAQTAERLGHNTMDFTYFTCTFYKKGTCHIKFNENARHLIDRLNIFAACGRQWLPPGYGKVSYDSMDEQSRAVIDEFQGKEEYAKVVANPSRYIVSPASAIPQLKA